MTGLRKSLNLVSLTFYGVGMILGAGIYSVIGAAAGAAGHALWLSFALSSVIVLLTAFSYAELAGMFPEAGAEYVYLRQAFPKQRVIAFVTSSLVALSGAATTAAVSIAFAGYLGHFISAPDAVVAGLVLLAAAVVAIIGIQESSWVNILFTCLEVAGLILFIAIGIRQPEFGSAIVADIHSGVLAGAALVFFSFLGFQNIANLAEEAKHPDKLHWAILLSVGISTAIYVSVGVAAVALLNPDELASSESPLATALAAHSRQTAGALGGIALFATANTALISVITTSRVCLSMARKNDLPKVFARILPKRKTPFAATLLVVVVSGILLPLGKVDTVASVSSLAALLTFIAVNIALLRLRVQRPRVKRPFKVPMALGGLPVLPFVSLLLLVGLMTQFESRVYVVAGLALLVLAGFYVIYARLKRRAA